MKIITYSGQAPNVVQSPDLNAILDLFRQQNEVLKAAVSVVWLVPEGTRLTVPDLAGGADE